MIFDSVIRSTWQELAQLGPFISQLFMLDEKNPLFFIRPGGFVH